MQDVMKSATEKMEKTLKALENDYSAIRAGRANPAVLERINVDYYGVPTPIQQMAAVSVAESRVLVIQPWDKSVLDEVEKAIHTSDLGINPQNDGEVIRLNFPQLTEERRKEIVREISKLAEDTKITIRGHRRDALDKVKKMEKDSEISEDQLIVAEKDIQNLTDKYTDKIDKACEEKEKEVMEI